MERKGDKIDFLHCEAMPPGYKSCAVNTYRDIERRNKPNIDITMVTGVFQRILLEEKRTGKQCKVYFTIVYK